MGSEETRLFMFFSGTVRCFGAALVVKCKVPTVVYLFLGTMPFLFWISALV
ncbi:hypothetical protein HanIR_Chr01g0041011 [Helianthus annuus]|nr:hypothetical protein HanIR_Chr01g0041011 [Helianthus annuus]